MLKSQIKLNSKCFTRVSGVLVEVTIIAWEGPGPNGKVKIRTQHGNTCMRAPSALHLTQNPLQEIIARGEQIAAQKKAEAEKIPATTRTGAKVES